MTIRHRLRQSLHRLGLDIQRYPNSDPQWRVVQLLKHHGVDAVLDVGANDGGYARGLRRLGYADPIVSFEPVPGLFQQLQLGARKDPHWELWPYAVGDADGQVALNVAGNRGASSSILTMLEEHERAEPSSRTVATLQVPQRALDDVLDTAMTEGRRRLFLKIDVQGYEGAVLQGAARLLRSGRVAGLQVELSFAPLYADATPWQDVVEELGGLGFQIAGLIPGFSNPFSGRMYQADALFFTES